MQFRVLSVLLICLLSTATAATAQDISPTAGVEAAKKKVSSKRPSQLSADQTGKALEFARQHHAELADLLVQLKDSSPAGFKRGIREVHRAVQRLERIREKQPDRHARELKKWKTESRIRLLTAQWLMSGDPALEQEIKTLLQTRQQDRLEQLSADRDKLAARLRQLDEQISQAADDQFLDREWERLQKRTSVRAGNRRTKKTKQEE